MKDKIFGVLQRVGRSFMLPIAILPVAGLLLGLGSSFTNETTIATYHLQKVLGDGTMLHALLTIMNKVGSAIFDNLPLIFAVGVAIGMAKKEKEVAALSSMIAFFVMHVSISAMLSINGEILTDGSIAKDVLEGTVVQTFGTDSFNFRHNYIRLVFGYHSIQRITVKHTEHFKFISHLHGRSTCIRVASNNILPFTFCRNDEFLT